MRALRPVLGLLLLASLALLAAASIGNSGRRSRPPGAPNVVLVSIDTLRADRLSVYGYRRPTSPFLERLAREGILFERFYYNGGGTLPSHLTMMTSLHPATHGIGPRTPRRLEEERITMAEAFRQAGYATAAFVGGGWLSARFGFDQGFDLFDESGHGFAENLPKALDWLALHRDRSFFLFLHTYDVHSAWNRLPYDCPGDSELRFVDTAPEGFTGCRGEECASRFLSGVNERLRSGESSLAAELSAREVGFVSDLYDGCVRYADEQIERLYGELAAQGLLDRTLLVVTSDHGEEFGEHGFFLHDQGGYEELARIPLLMRLPDGRAGGRRVEGLAAMADVLPTLLELAGLPALAQAQGRSLVPAIPRLATRRAALHMYSVLRTDRYKYFSDERLLFDLAADPVERENLWASDSDLVRRFEREVRGLIRVDSEASRRFRLRAAPGDAPELSPEMERKLRSLGYLR